ncbi:unnamed protein product [Rhizoctonia solani]|uniref:T6SS Phospholipase effector Tle1-like catalytic domain-containing protein n=1 Tax=Rhizoctonia solani TaxID=456999 RepID=A0A8H2WED1_9AGAM|nr:unnamed protein product [Rhizoctonia solani]
MVSDPRLSFLRNHQKFNLKLAIDTSSGRVVVIATPVDGIGIFFDNPKDAEFDLTPYVGVVDDSLVWGISGLQTLAECAPTLWTSPQTNERYLQIIRPGGNAEASSKKVLNLDERLDIIEAFDPDSREVRRRLGLKHPNSKRSIVMCFDGTSNHFSNQNTNVVKLVELLKKDDPSQQMVYYQPGIGTYSHPGLKTSIGSKISAKLDQGIAWYLYQHVIDGYKYLMQTYRGLLPATKSVFLDFLEAHTQHELWLVCYTRLGFSQDIIKAQQVTFAYQIYERWNTESRDDTSKQTKIEPGAANVKPWGAGEKQSVNDSALPENVDPERFKMTYCIPVKITFLGVWDTVGSVGIFGKPLPWIEHNPSIKCFRQALALDENRGNFIPMVWNHSKTDKLRQDISEVWFKGGHADIGGGADAAPASKIGKKEQGQPDRLPELSNIALRWMVRQCLITPHVSVLFDPDAIRRYRDFGILEERSATPTELQGLDDFDMTQEPYIALDESMFWKVLEWLPVPKVSQRRSRDSQPQNVWSPNRAAPRAVNHQPKDHTDNICLHSSVYRNIQNTNYEPAAKWYNWPHNRWPFLADAQALKSVVMTSTDKESEKVIGVLGKNMESRQKPDPKIEDDD